MNAAPITLALACIALAGSSRIASDHLPVERATEISVSEVAYNCSRYRKITKEEVLVNPDLAARCVGVSQSTMEAVRARFGPHANAGILIYMNDAAAEAFDKGTLFPMGAVVVKCKSLHRYRGGDGKWAQHASKGVGGMVKRAPGYDPWHGDWEYFYFDEPTKIESGRITSCVSCHESAKSTDYVFGTWRRSGAKEAL